MLLAFNYEASYLIPLTFEEHLIVRLGGRDFVKNSIRNVF